MSQDKNNATTTAFASGVAAIVDHWASLGKSVIEGRDDASWSEHADELAQLFGNLADESVKRAVCHLLRDVASGTAFSVLSLIDGARDWPPSEIVVLETGVRCGNGMLHEVFQDVVEAKRAV